jgi:hypothetical protein
VPERSAGTGGSRAKRRNGESCLVRYVRTRIDESIDWLYLKDWAAKFDVAPNWMNSPVNDTSPAAVGLR